MHNFHSAEIETLDDIKSTLKSYMLPETNEF